MGRSIPIRDLAGKIVGLRAEGQEPDPVQETLDASLKAVGAIPQAQGSSSGKPDTVPTPSPLRIALGAVALCVWIVGLVWLSRTSQPAPRIAPAPAATVAVTRTPSPSATPTAVPPTATNTPEQPTATPEIPDEPAAPPQSLFQPAAPALSFCADRKSIWGETHQCAASQAEADSLADAEIGRINATAEAIRNSATK